MGMLKLSEKIALKRLTVFILTSAFKETFDPIGQPPRQATFIELN